MKYLSLEDIKSDLAWLQEHGGNDIPLREIAERMEFLIPAADVAPVVHGRWESDHGIPIQWDKYNPGCPAGSSYCSVCGEWLTASDEYASVGRYCPNCGAKMDL